jgi:hypothetical protein
MNKIKEKILDDVADNLSGLKRREYAKKMLEHKITIDGLVNVVLMVFDAGMHRGASNPYC